jgi:hypothetical protein
MLRQIPRVSIFFVFLFFFFKKKKLGSSEHIHVGPNLIGSDTTRALNIR